MGYCMQLELVLLWGYTFPVLDCRFAQILTPANNQEVLHISPVLGIGGLPFSRLSASVFPFRLPSLLKVGLDLDKRVELCRDFTFKK